MAPSGHWDSRSCPLGEVLDSVLVPVEPTERAMVEYLSWVDSTILSGGNDGQGCFWLELGGGRSLMPERPAGAVHCELSEVDIQWPR